MEDNRNPQEQVKKPWFTPELTIYGTVDEITQMDVTKYFGAGDGFVYNIPGIDGPVPIHS
jgi:hypothetical protein